MNKLGIKIPIHVKVYISRRINDMVNKKVNGFMKTISPPRTFSLLLDFVEANVPTHVDVYLLKCFVKVLEY